MCYVFLCRRIIFLFLSFFPAVNGPMTGNLIWTHRSNLTESRQSTALSLSLILSTRSLSSVHRTLSSVCSSMPSCFIVQTIEWTGRQTDDRQTKTAAYTCFVLCVCVWEYSDKWWCVVVWSSHPVSSWDIILINEQLNDNVWRSNLNVVSNAIVECMQWVKRTIQH